MKVQRIVCDRCGTELPRDGARSRHHRVHLVYRRWDRRTLLPVRGEFELCSPCRRALVEWLGTIGDILPGLPPPSAAPAEPRESSVPPIEATARSPVGPGRGGNFSAAWRWSLVSQLFVPAVRMQERGAGYLWIPVRLSRNGRPGSWSLDLGLWDPKLGRRPPPSERLKQEP